ncbi:uncharacterized protein LOC100119183 isoform X2 [Nasonia vitripennis]|nr:uncharacterized protein LOC100119183 isoform X2 [Nasonia vitripennis]
MLFLWSREPVPAAVGASPRAGPWFAWFATAVLLWRCRRRIARAVLGATAPLRLLKRKRGGGLSTSVVVSKAHHHHHQPKSLKQQQSPIAVQQQLQLQPRHHHHRRHRVTLPSAPDTPEEHQRSSHLKHHQSSSSPSEPQKPQAQCREVNAVTKSRLRRLHAGDGPHMNVGRKLTMSASCYQISQQLYCRMTRSGCVYGRYPTKSSVK